MIRVIAFAFLLVALATSKPEFEFEEPEVHTVIKPEYEPEDVENLDVQHILRDLFKNNGENVEDYLDLSDFPQTPDEVPPAIPDHFTLLANSLPAELGSTPGIIRHNGYPCEEHWVTTRDGYILALHRIPRRPHLRQRDRRAPVLLQHGLLDSSAAWVLTGKERGLAFILSDRGHDVWLGNFRGNRYSRNHTTLNPDGRRRERREFWDFSWHEMGTEDIPTMIDYILAQDRTYRKLHYFGHSQGTTAFFVTASERPEYNDKVYAMHALAPVVFTENMAGLAARAFARLVTRTQFILSLFGRFELLTGDSLLNDLGYETCRNRVAAQLLCRNIYFLLFGFDSQLFDIDLLPIIMKNTPAGSAVKQVAHYGQGIRSGHFARFDYGRSGNRRLYGSREPPNYRLEKVRCPVHLAYGLNDNLAAVVDVKRLNDALPNVISLYEVPHRRFNHVDFIWGLGARKLVYDHSIALLDRAERGAFN